MTRPWARRWAGSWRSRWSPAGRAGHGRGVGQSRSRFMKITPGSTAEDRSPPPWQRGRSGCRKVWRARVQASLISAPCDGAGKRTDDDEGVTGDQCLCDQRSAPRYRPGNRRARALPHRHQHGCEEDRHDEIQTETLGIRHNCAGEVAPAGSQPPSHTTASTRRRTRHRYRARPRRDNASRSASWHRRGRRSPWRSAPGSRRPCKAGSPRPSGSSAHSPFATRMVTPSRPASVHGSCQTSSATICEAPAKTVAEKAMVCHSSSPLLRRRRAEGRGEDHSAGKKRQGEARTEADAGKGEGWARRAGHCGSLIRRFHARPVTLREEYCLHGLPDRTGGSNPGDRRVCHPAGAYGHVQGTSPQPRQPLLRSS